MLRLEREGVTEIGCEIGGALAGNPVDEIERDVVKSGITKMMHGASDVVRSGNALEHAQELRLERLRAERDAGHAGSAQRARELRRHRLGVRLDRHLGGRRQRLEQPHELGQRGEGRRAAAEEDRLELRREQRALELELLKQRVDVGAVLPAAPDDGDEVAVAAAVRAEGQVHVEMARAAHAATRFGRAHELAAAVRADALHLLGARNAERALERADARLAVGRERGAAALADGSHLERHQRLAAPLPDVEHREERLLRHLDRADLLHALLALLLVLEQLALARDVAAVALCEHVLAARLHRLARDHARADRGLDRHVEHLARDLLAQLLDEQLAALVGEVAMDDQRQRIDHLAADEHVDANEVAGLEAGEVVVERGVAARARLQLVVEVEHDLAERQVVRQVHAHRREVLHVVEGAAAIVAELHHCADELLRDDDRRLDVRLLDLLHLARELGGVVHLAATRRCAPWRGRRRWER